MRDPPRLAVASDGQLQAQDSPTLQAMGHCCFECPWQVLPTWMPTPFQPNYRRAYIHVVVMVVVAVVVVKEVVELWQDC